jgi:hypothetical protein
MNNHIQRLFEREDFTVPIAPDELHHTSPIPSKGQFKQRLKLGPSRGIADLYVN